MKAGVKIVHGVREPKPIIGAPEGRQRLRMRSDSIAKLFVKTSDGIRQFVLEDCGQTWRACFEQARNLRA
jgi:hypothetical protein